ncbi:MAG: cell division protein FtsQ/DivIB [Saprospiraceae bacterium]
MKPLSNILPRLRYDRISWVLFIILVAAFWMSAINNKKHSFPNDIRIEVEPLENGLKLITERDVKQALFLAFGNTLMSTELHRLEVGRIESVLEDDPFVRQSDAWIDRNNILHVRIRQRRPILRILDKEGENYYIDAQGAMMPPSRNFTAHVLVATGAIGPYVRDFREKKNSPLRDVFELAQYILADDFLASLCQQIHVNNMGDIELVPLLGKQKIILGNTRNLDDKFGRLKTFYREAMPYAGWQTYKIINLKFNGQIVCRK